MDKIKIAFKSEADKKKHQESVNYDEKYVYYIVDPNAPVYPSSK